MDDRTELLSDQFNETQDGEPTECQTIERDPPSNISEVLGENGASQSPAERRAATINLVHGQARFLSAREGSPLADRAGAAGLALSRAERIAHPRVQGCCLCGLVHTNAPPFKNAGYIRMIHCIFLGECNEAYTRLLLGKERSALDARAGQVPCPSFSRSWRMNSTQPDSSCPAPS
eukprot:jgi/Mesvir1/3536/Mv12007-RA.1